MKEIQKILRKNYEEGDFNCAEEFVPIGCAISPYIYIHQLVTKDDLRKIIEARRNEG